MSIWAFSVIRLIRGLVFPTRITLNSSVLLAVALNLFIMPALYLRFGRTSKSHHGGTENPEKKTI